MFFRFNFFSHFCLTIDSNQQNDIIKYFLEEYGEYGSTVTNDNEILPCIGNINIVESLKLPKEVTVIINGSTYSDKEFFYFQYSSRLLSISLDSSKFSINVEKDFSPLIVFCVAEVLLRLYSTNHDILFLHASSFHYLNKTFIINAFGGVGKTNLLLDILDENGIYLADDIIAISKSNHVYPYRKRINLLYYNFFYKIRLLKNIGVSSIWASVLKFLMKLEDAKIYRYLMIYKIVARLKGKLNCHVSHKLIARSDEQKASYAVDYFIWMERTFTVSQYFPLSRSEFVKNMSACLFMENTQVDRWYECLEAFSLIPKHLRAKQDMLLENIAALNKIIGIKKQSADDRGIFNLIREMAVDTK